MDLDFDFDLIPIDLARDKNKEKIISHVQVECLEKHIGRAMAFRNLWVYLNGKPAENQN